MKEAELFYINKIELMPKIITLYFDKRTDLQKVYFAYRLLF